MNYWLQRKEKISKNIYNKRLDKLHELAKNIDYGDLKVYDNSSDLEINFSELKDPVAFLDSFRKP